MRTILTQRWLLNRRHFLRGLGATVALLCILCGHSAADPPENKSAAAATKPIAPGGASAMPATATKDAPFINMLGMKFVPVPITGGPTGGQRMLFSVWET